MAVDTEPKRFRMMQLAQTTRVNLYPPDTSGVSTGERLASLWLYLDLANVQTAFPSMIIGRVVNSVIEGRVVNSAISGRVVNTIVKGRIV